MKWVGQHIYDFISRFRSDVYLEDIDSGTIASGGNLGLDSNNKIVKSASPSGTIDLTSEVTGTLPVANGGTGATSLTDNSVLTGTGTSAITAEANFTYSGTALSINALTSTFTNATNSQVIIKNTGNNTAGGVLDFINERGTGVDGDNAGQIRFYSDDDGGNATQVVDIKGIINETANGSEEGSFTIQTLSGGQSLRQGFLLNTTAGNDIVNCTIGFGTSSTTTIAGTLTMGSTAAMTNAGLLSVANQTGITGLGTISSGTWQGTAVASAYLDADTAHLTTDQTFTGKKIINHRTFNITAGSSAGEYMGDVVYTGTTTSMTTGDLYVYNNAGNWVKANASATATSTGLLAIALGAESDTHGMLLRGMVTSGAVGGTPDEGAILYIRATDGDITTVAPSSSSQVVRIVGYCMENSNDRIWFDPDKTWVEIA